MITPEQLATWLENPVTRALLHYLREVRAEAMEAWARGELVCETEHQTLLQDARLHGRLELAREIFELEIEPLANLEKEQK